MISKVITIFLHIFLFAILTAKSQVNSGEQSVGGSPMSAVGNVSGTGSNLEQVNLTNLFIHIGIPLVRLKGIGIDTEIDYDYNTPYFPPNEVLLYITPPSRVGFRRSGTIEWPQAENLPVLDNGDIDDGWQGDGPDCDDDDDPCGLCDPETDPDGCLGGEARAPSQSTNSVSNYYDISDVPFVSTDGAGGMLKQPVVLFMPDIYQATEFANLYSTDGSYLKYVPGRGVIYPDGVSTLDTRDDPDLFGFPKGGTILQDIAGNMITCGYGDVPNNIATPSTPMNMTIGVQTCTDTRNRSIKFSYDTYGNVTDIAYPGTNGNILHVTIQYVDRVFNLGVDFKDSTPQHVPLPGRITLADGGHYDFTFTPGGLTPLKLTTPGGGYISYVYGVQSSDLLERHISADGSASNEQVYKYGVGATSECDDYGIVYNPWTSVTWPSGAIETFTQPNGRIDFVDYTLKDASGHLLQSKHKDWESNESAGEFSKGTLRCAPHNPRPHDEIDTDDAGNTRVTTYSYDVNNNVTGTTISRHPSPFASDVLRQTQSTYVDATLGSSTGGGYFNANILRLPLSTSTTGIGGNASSGSFRYDEPTYSPIGIAGKLTSAYKTLDSSGTVATSHTKYEAHGIAYESIDPLGTVTHLAIDPTSLLATSITTGYGSGLDQTSILSVDPSTALLVSIKSPNDIAAGGPGKRFSYDADNRVREIDYPDGSFETSSLVFGSSYPFATVTKTHSSATDPLVSVTTMDGLMREITTLSPDSSTVETGYDVLGRQSDKTNPHLPSSSPTDGAVHSVYDDLGRQISETHRAQQNGIFVDISQRTWNPIGLVTTMVDELNHSHVQTKDILGHLVSVQEPAASGTGLGATTTYVYDSLDNLISVTQAGIGGESARVRVFQYDAASRLIKSCNPELLPVGQICDGTHWTENYSYYANDDIFQKVDARGVMTTYNYDPLHRLLSKTYSNAPAGTLSTCYSYETATNGISLLAAEWTQLASQICPVQMPTTGYQTARVIATYDLMGRIKDEKQCFFGSCVQGTSGFEFNYAYDPAGNQSTKSDGIGQLSWFDSFDSAGRLLAVDTISVLPYPVPTTRLFTANGYGPGGLLTQWGLGLVGAYPALLATKRYDFEMRPTSEEYRH